MWILVLAAIASIANAQTPADPPPKTLIVTHKLPEFGDLNRKTYEQQVIELALEKTRKKVGAFEMMPINIISRTHAVAALSKNLYQNFVIALSYEDELLKSGDLIYIPFPLELGALSYRICYANKKFTKQVREIDSLQELKAYKVGVGTGWVDAKILHHHGLQIVEGSNITGLFRMTQAGRTDLFCPSPTEYFHELDIEKATDFQLDNKLALYYPLPKFLFSHKSNQALMDRIKEGIDIAYKDGSFQQLWREVHEADLKRAKLDERHFIKMENPFITTLNDDYKRYLINPLEY
ncbi:hypothetical protein [Cellvibrio sp.]|jgi:Bacterial extracellular solute-binding proteins, family 3